MKKTVLLGGVALCFLLGVQRGYASTDCGSVSGNLVANCGFESGDFTSWNLSGFDVPGQQDNLYGVEGADPVLGISPNNGSNQAFFGDLTANATTIAQSIATLAASTYTVTFYLAEGQPPVTPDGPNALVVSFGGVQLANLTDIADGGYTEYTYDVAASGPSSALSLTLGNDTGYFLLDDVSVTQDGALTATPEPSSMVLLATGLAGMTWAGSRRKLFA